jgi:hypothetical protein
MEEAGRTRLISIAHWCCRYSQEPVVSQRSFTLSAPGLGKFKTMSHRPIVYSVLAAFCQVSAYAYADNTAPIDADARESQLQVTITPFYGWVPGMSGSVAVFGVDASLDVSPLDIARNIDDLLPLVDGIYLGGGEVRYRDFGFLYDVIFLDVSINQNIDGRFVKGSFGVGFRQSTATFAGSYRLFASEHAHLDAVAGVRIWDIETSLQLDTNILSAGISDGDSWVDPMIGAKGTIDIAPGWALTGWALIGGFGAGSEFAWDLYGAIDHACSDRLTLSLGMRAFAADYHNGDFSWDMIQYGPMANASLKF